MNTSTDAVSVQISPLIEVERNVLANTLADVIPACINQASITAHIPIITEALRQHALSQPDPVGYLSALAAALVETAETIPPASLH